MCDKFKEKYKVKQVQENALGLVKTNVLMVNAKPSTSKTHIAQNLSLI